MKANESFIPPNNFWNSWNSASRHSLSCGVGGWTEHISATFLEHSTWTVSRKAKKLSFLPSRRSFFFASENLLRSSRIFGVSGISGRFCIVCQTWLIWVGPICSNICLPFCPRSMHRSLRCTSYSGHNGEFATFFLWESLLWTRRNCLDKFRWTVVEPAPEARSRERPKTGLADAPRLAHRTCRIEWCLPLDFLEDVHEPSFTIRVDSWCLNLKLSQLLFLGEKNQVNARISCWTVDICHPTLRQQLSHNWILSHSPQLVRAAPSAESFVVAHLMDES